MLLRSQSFEKMRSQHGKRGRHAAICAGGQGRGGEQHAHTLARAHLHTQRRAHTHARVWMSRCSGRHMASGPRPAGPTANATIFSYSTKSLRSLSLPLSSLCRVPLPSIVYCPSFPVLLRLLLTFSFFAPRFLPPVGNMPRSDRYEYNDSDSKTINGSAT